jgi:hypothetical protein
MLSWPFGPALRAADHAKQIQGFSLGKHKKTFGPVGAGKTRWFTEVNVTRNSTTFLVRARHIFLANPR